VESRLGRKERTERAIWLARVGGKSPVKMGKGRSHHMGAHLKSNAFLPSPPPEGVPPDTGLIARNYRLATEVIFFDLPGWVS
jgi:hypothetical protein